MIITFHDYILVWSSYRGIYFAKYYGGGGGGKNGCWGKKMKTEGVGKKIKKKGKGEREKRRKRA